MTSSNCCETVHGEPHIHQQQRGQNEQQEAQERQMRLEQELDKAQEFVEVSLADNPLRQGAAVWAAAVMEHQKEGHRAFTGAGYQEQYELAQEKLRQLKKTSGDSSGEIIDSGKIGGKSSFIEALSKAIFGPPEIHSSSAEVLRKSERDPAKLGI